jgi:hypothetical protein
MLTIARFIPEKFGSCEKLAMLHADWLRGKISSAWAGPSKNRLGCVLLPLFHHYAQCDDERSIQEDMSAASPPESQLFSGVSERPSKSWSGWNEEERGRFSNSFETDFG